MLKQSKQDKPARLIFSGVKSFVNIYMKSKLNRNVPQWIKITKKCIFVFGRYNFITLQYFFVLLSQDAKFSIDHTSSKLTRKKMRI
jgi:hypothetical protein